MSGLLGSQASGDSIVFSDKPLSGELFALNKGDVIEFVCDYYSYDGEYLDSYVFGKSITYDGNLEISYVELPDTSKANAVYRFTDIYNQTYWTPVMPVTE